MCIKLGSNPPAFIEPYEVTLKYYAQPFKTSQRRYAPRQNDFICSTVLCLASICAMKKNPFSKWASPTLAVPKPGTDTFRFTVDLKWVNRKTIEVSSSMPDMETMTSPIYETSGFAQVDMCHAYWQLPLGKLSQEVMTVQTPLGIFSPIRVLQCSTDAANHFQAATSAELV